MRLASKRRSCAYDECRRVAVSRGPIENFVAKVLVAITKRDVDVDRALPLTVHGHRLLPAHALVKGIGILDAGAPAEFDGTWKGNEQSQQTGARGTDPRWMQLDNVHSPSSPPSLGKPPSA